MIWKIPVICISLNSTSKLVENEIKLTSPAEAQNIKSINTFVKYVFILCIIGV